MRRMIIVGVLVMSAILVNAQTFDEWFKQKETQIKYLVEQIIALKGYAEVVNKGYDIAQNGLTSIADSKDGDHKQHSNYFLSLWKVKANIKSYSKVLSIYEMKADIERQYQLIKSSVSEFLNDKEKIYINAVYSNLCGHCSDLVNETEMVISDDQLQLKDDERIQRIDRIYFEMQDHYRFSQSFASEIKSLVTNRIKETNKIIKLSSLYGIK